MKWEEIKAHIVKYILNIKTGNLPVSIVTKYRGYLFQTLNDKEIYDWLYAINPLLAGEIKSKMARNNKNQDNNSMKEQENIQNQCNI